MKNHVPIVVLGVLHTEGDQTKVVGDRQRQRAPSNRRDLSERSQLLNGEMSEGASGLMDDTIPPPATLPTHTSANPSASKPGGKHNPCIHFPNDPTCGICKRTKITRAFRKICLEDRSGFSVAENLGDLITDDHQVLNEENDSRVQQIYSVLVGGMGSTSHVHNRQRRTREVPELANRANTLCVAGWRRRYGDRADQCFAVVPLSLRH